MTARKQRFVIEGLLRLVHAPRPRAVRVRAVIYARWRRELRRARYRFIRVVVGIAVASAVIVAATVYWIKSWVP